MSDDTIAVHLRSLTLMGDMLSLTVATTVAHWVLSVEGLPCGRQHGARFSVWKPMLCRRVTRVNDNLVFRGSPSQEFVAEADGTKGRVTHDPWVKKDCAIRWPESMVVLIRPTVSSFTMVLPL